LLGMGDGLVDGRARRTQIRELRLAAVAPQHIGRREDPGAALIGARALQDGPVDASGCALGRGIGHILEAAVDEGFEPIRLRLGFLMEIAAIPPVTPVLRPACASLVSRPAVVAGTGPAIAACGRSARLL